MHPNSLCHKELPDHSYNKCREFRIAVLLWICKTLDGIIASARQILQMIKTTLLAKGFILELCTNKPPPPKTTSPQLFVEGLL
jgi:hypothetical protein